MTPAQWLAHCAWLCRYGVPMTLDELSDFNQSKARTAAQDEQRRNPQPQLELQT